MLGKTLCLSLFPLKMLILIITKRVFFGTDSGEPLRPNYGLTRATKRSAQFPRTLRSPTPTGFGRGARFALRVRAVERPSFRPAFTVKTASYNKSLSVRRTSALGERYIEKLSSYEAVRRRMISGRFRRRGRGPTKSLLRHHDLQKLDCRLLMYDRMTY